MYGDTPAPQTQFSFFSSLPLLPPKLQEETEKAVIKKANKNNICFFTFKVTSPFK